MHQFGIAKQAINGGSDDYTATITGWVNGGATYFGTTKLQFVGSNSGASSLSINGATPAEIKKLSSGSLVDVEDGDIIDGYFYDVSYDGTQFIIEIAAAEVIGPQTANTVYAGPTTGSPALPAFRALVPADIPNLDLAKITSTSFNGVLKGNGSIITTASPGTDFAPATPGSGTILKSNGSGGFDFAVAGTDFLAPFPNQNANAFYAGPTTGAAAQPAFRAMVAADLPTVPINKGGTNATSQTSDGVAFYNGTSITTASTFIWNSTGLGVGLTPTSRFHVQGAAAGTASMVKFQNSTPTVLFDMTEAGVTSFTGGASGAGATAYTFTPTLTATANSQTQYAADINLIPVDGAFTGLTRSFMRMRTNSSGTNLYDFGTSTFTTTSLTSADFNGGNMRLRNTTGPFNIQGGSGSTDCIRFSGVFTNSVDNHIAFRFTNGGSANSTALHTAGTAITRTWNAIVKDWTVSSVNGSTITYLVDKVTPLFSLGNSTATITGIDYNPDFTGSSGTITHYAMRIRSGLSAFGQTNAPTAFMDLAASTTAAASLRIRSGTAPSSPNDGDIWYDGTDIKMRVGGTTKTFTLV